MLIKTSFLYQAEHFRHTRESFSLLAQITARHFHLECGIYAHPPPQLTSNRPFVNQKIPAKLDRITVQMLKLVILFLGLSTLSFCSVITSGHFDLPSGAYDLSGNGFDLRGTIDTTGLVFGNTLEPYASPLGQNSSGFYSYSQFTIESSTYSYFQLSGLSVYGSNPVESAPFHLQGEFNLGTCSMLCDLMVEGSGTVTFSWQYSPDSSLYSMPQVVYTFAAPATDVDSSLSAVPEPSTSIMAGFVTAGWGCWRWHRRRLKYRREESGRISLLEVAL